MALVDHAANHVVAFLVKETTALMRITFLRTLTFLTCFSGCAHRVDFGQRGRIEDPAALLALTAEAEERVHAVSSPARLAVDSEAIKASMPMFAALAGPNRIYFEIHDFFGKPQATLATDGLWLGLYRADENKYYNGPASSQNVSRLMPLELPADAWVGIFLARPPKMKGTSKLSFDEKAGSYRLEIEGEGDAQQTLWIEPQHHRVVRAEVRGPVSYEVVYGDFDRSVAHFPRELHLVSHSPPGRLDLAYKGPELNPSLDPQTFTPKAPEGAMSLPLPEGGMP
jgi:hypothetical protein